MNELEIDNLATVWQDGVAYVSWRRADLRYSAAAGDYVKVCLGLKAYERGRIIAIDETGFDMDIGVGLIFKKVRADYSSVTYIEKRQGGRCYGLSESAI